MCSGEAETSRNEVVGGGDRLQAESASAGPPPCEGPVLGLLRVRGCGPGWSLLSGLFASFWDGARVSW